MIEITHEDWSLSSYNLYLDQYRFHFISFCFVFVFLLVMNLSLRVKKKFMQFIKLEMCVDNIFIINNNRNKMMLMENKHMGYQFFIWRRKKNEIQWFQIAETYNSGCFLPMTFIEKEEIWIWIWKLKWIFVLATFFSHKSFFFVKLYTS